MKNIRSFLLTLTLTTLASTNLNAMESKSETYEMAIQQLAQDLEGEDAINFQTVYDQIMQAKKGMISAKKKAAILDALIATAGHAAYKLMKLKNKLGQTSLHLSALWGRKDEVEYLLDTCDSYEELYGFINERDYADQTAWEYATPEVKGIMQEYLDKKNKTKFLILEFKA